jgi:hypothetical protein
MQKVLRFLPMPKKKLPPPPPSRKPRSDAMRNRERILEVAKDTVAGGSMRLIEGSRSLIHAAFVTSVKRAIDSGELRADTDPNDFLACSLASSTPRLRLAGS